jgi:hypothetical protein
MRLGESDDELRDAMSSEIRRSLMAIVSLRNKTTHEVEADEMRDGTLSLLDAIDDVLAREAIAALL